MRRGEGIGPLTRGGDIATPQNLAQVRIAGRHHLNEEFGQAGRLPTRRGLGSRRSGDMPLIPGRLLPEPGGECFSLVQNGDTDLAHASQWASAVPFRPGAIR
jgi:hypothetical protein